MTDNKEMILVEKLKYNELQKSNKQCKTCEFKAKLKEYNTIEQLKSENTKLCNTLENALILIDMAVDSDKTSTMDESLTALWKAIEIIKDSLGK